MYRGSRGLGDTANDLAIYGSKIYIVANVSSTIEIIAYHSLVIERKTHQRTVILIEQSFAQRIEFGCIRLCRVTCDVQ